MKLQTDQARGCAISVTDSVDLNTSIEMILPFILESNKIKAWVPELIHGVDAMTEKVMGSSYEQTFSVFGSRRLMKGKITAYQVPGEIIFEGSAGSINFLGRYTILPVGESCINLSFEANFFANNSFNQFILRAGKLALKFKHKQALSRLTQCFQTQ